MRRVLANTVIVTYLGMLALGVACYTLKFGSGVHPAMYYFTWDMFCGWSAHETRYHVLGEGVSGNYYLLTPGPDVATSFKPFGDLSRNHYDALGNSIFKMANSTLRRTEHEPMRRLVFVEEVWPKKYNMADTLWSQRFPEPRQPVSYFWRRAVWSPEGEVLEANGEFVQHLTSRSIFDNPRLLADTRRGQPFLAINTTGPSAWLDDTEK